MKKLILALCIGLFTVGQTTPAQQKSIFYSYNATALIQTGAQFNKLPSEIYANVLNKTASTLQQIKMSPTWQNKVTPAWERTYNFLSIFGNGLKRNKNLLYLGAAAATVTLTPLFLYLLYKTCCGGQGRVYRAPNNVEKNNNKNNKNEEKEEEKKFSTFFDSDYALLKNLGEDLNREVEKEKITKKNEENNSVSLKSTIFKNIKKENEEKNNNIDTEKKITENKENKNNENNKNENIVLDPDAPLPPPDFSSSTDDNKSTNKADNSNIINEQKKQKQVQLIQKKMATALRELEACKNLLSFVQFLGEANEATIDFSLLEKNKILTFKTSPNGWPTGNDIDNAKLIIGSVKKFYHDKDIKDIETYLRSYLDAKNKPTEQLNYTTQEVKRLIKNISEKHDTEILKMLELVAPNKKTLWSDVCNGTATFNEKTFKELLELVSSLTSFSTLTSYLTKKGNLFGQDTLETNLIIKASSVGTDQKATPVSTILPVLKSLANTVTGLKPYQWSKRSLQRVLTFYAFDETIARNFKELESLDPIKKIANECGINLLDISSLSLTSGSVILTNNKDIAPEEAIKKINNLMPKLMNISKNTGTLASMAQELINAKKELVDKKPVVQTNKNKEVKFGADELINMKNKLKKVVKADKKPVENEKSKPMGNNLKKVVKEDEKSSENEEKSELQEHLEKMRKELEGRGLDEEEDSDSDYDSDEDDED